MSVEAIEIQVALNHLTPTVSPVENSFFYFQSTFFDSFYNVGVEFSSLIPVLREYSFTVTDSQFQLNCTVAIHYLK